MYSKFRFDSNWRLGGAWSTQLVSQWGLKYPISDTMGSGLPNRHAIAPGYPRLPSSKSEQVIVIIRSKLLSHSLFSSNINQQNLTPLQNKPN